MKITLEFEEIDLRKMLTDHFVREGFSIKNLNTICQQFLLAFPDGLKIEADIAPMPEHSEEPASEDSHVYAVDKNVVYQSAANEDVDEDPGIDDAREDAIAPLTLTDLMDPTPRMPRSDTNRPPKPMRIVSLANDAVTDIESIVRQSKNMEKRPK